MTWIVRDGRLMERGSAEDHASRQRGPRSALATPMLVRDHIGPVTSQLDGRTYESRSELYDSYRRGGVRIVEGGEQPTSPARSRISKAEVGAALQKVRQGYKPAPLGEGE